MYWKIFLSTTSVTNDLLPEVTVFVILAFLVLAVQVEISAAKLLLNHQTSGKRINVISHESGK